MISLSSLDAAPPAGAELLFSSTCTRWRSVLLRAYREPLSIDDYTTTPTPDQKIVLVTAGACRIEAYGGRWRHAAYHAGHVGLVAPGEAARLRWRGRERHHTVQLHIPGETVTAISRELFGTPAGRHDALRCLSLTDPAVATTVLALDRAARKGAPELYAETAAHFLVSHLLLRGTGLATRPQAVPAAAVLHRVDAFKQASLPRAVSLAELAGVAGVSRFQLLRMTKRAWGETPQRRLTRMRMVHAQHLLLDPKSSVIEVALACGYANPTHFATAFKRVTGLSPSRYARQGRC